MLNKMPLAAAATCRQRPATAPYPPCLQAKKNGTAPQGFVSDELSGGDQRALVNTVLSDSTQVQAAAQGELAYRAAEELFIQAECPLRADVFPGCMLSLMPPAFQPLSAKSPIALIGHMVPSVK